MEDGTVDEVFDGFVGRIENGCEEGKSSTLIFLQEKREVEIDIPCGWYKVDSDYLNINCFPLRLDIVQY